MCQYVVGGKMSVRKDIKLLLTENETTITFVAKEMTRISGHNYTRSNLSQKLSRKTLKYEEAKLIGQILGYDLKFVRTKPYV